MEPSALTAAPVELTAIDVSSFCVTSPELNQVLNFLYKVTFEIKLDSKTKGLFCECHGRGQNSNKTWAVPQEAKCKYSMPLVLLHQSAIEIMSRS